VLLSTKWNTSEVAGTVTSKRLEKCEETLSTNRCELKWVDDLHERKPISHSRPSPFFAEKALHEVAALLFQHTADDRESMIVAGELTTEDG
jgi:hypothetical protein